MLGRGRLDGFCGDRLFGGGKLPAQLPVGQGADGVAAVVDGKEGIRVGRLEERGEALFRPAHVIALPLPVHKDDGGGLLRAVGLQRVAVEDVPFQDEAGGLLAPGPARAAAEFCIVGAGPEAQEVGAAGGDVIGEDVDAVEGGEGAEGLAAEAGGVVAAAGLGAGGGKFAAEDLDEEVAVAAGGLEEAGADVGALGGDEVAHVADEPIRGEDLPVVPHPFAGLDESLFRFVGLRH